MPQKIRLQKAIAVKPRIGFKEQNIISRLRKELQNPATPTVDNSQRMPLKAKVQTATLQASLKIKLFSVLLHKRGMRFALKGWTRLFYMHLPIHNVKCFTQHFCSFIL